MKISDLLCEESVELGAHLPDKRRAIERLIDLQMKNDSISDRRQYEQAIWQRERQGSTAVGEGIAVPHAKSGAVSRPSLAAVTAPDGVDFEALDHKPSRLLFMIAAPNNGELHLEVLSRLMTVLMDEPFREELLSAETPADFIRLLDKKEAERFPQDGKAEKKKESEGPRVLAVTACPTGIAHTYMAAEALEKAAQELGISIKVETNGSGGVKNALTREEIERADGIIVAADKTVETARFHGKRVVMTKVSDGIKKPEELLNRIVSGNAPVYHSDRSAASDPVEEEHLGRRLYKHLMNGVSHMLPFVVGGGIFIALAFLIDTAAGAVQNATFGSNTAPAAFFKTVGGYAFDFMLPVLAGFIGKSIADRPGLLVGFVGGTLAGIGSTFLEVGGSVPSGFLGALFAGFAGGYFMLFLRRLCGRLPASLEGVKPVLIYPLAGLGFIAVIMCAVNPVMGMLNTALTDFLTAMSSTSKVVLGCLLGGMMSIDMGGPFNKAAYVFGTAAIASGNTDIMAAVMAGGMVPPLAIALAVTFFKRKFTPDEIKNGPVNYIMGFSFITEGAIPYAAADPLRVIPACAVGAAVAGGLSMLFGCTLMAPHGGIFVLAVVGNRLAYLLALAAGSLVGMLLLALFKKQPKGEND